MEAEIASTKSSWPMRLTKIVAAVVGLVVVTIVGFASWIIYEMNEPSRWRSFIAKQECKVIERKEAVITELPPRWVDGREVRGTTSTGAKELWQCKDNARYWKPAGLAERIGK